MSNTSFSSVTKLVAFKNLAPGIFTSNGKDRFSASELNLLSSNRLEHGFSGQETMNFFGRVKQALSRLPSGCMAQFVVVRSRIETNGGLFSAPGLKTRLYLIENEVPGSQQNSLLHFSDELGLKPKPLHKEDLDRLVSKLLGVSGKVPSGTIPDLVWEQDHLRVGPSRVKVASLTDAPQSTWPGLLQGLLEKDDEFVLSLKFGIPDRKKTRRDFETRRRISHALSIRKSNELSNMNSDTTLGAAEEVLTRLGDGKEAVTNVSMSVIVSDSDPARALSRMEAIAGDSSIALGAGLYIEEVGSLPVLKAHLPAQKTLAPRELPMLTGNLAHFLPLLLDYNREQSGGALKFVSRAGEISHMSFFSQTNLNFSSFLCGASGSGKSFLMNALTASFMEDFPGGAISIFDVGGSYRKIVARMKGTSLELTPSQATSLVVESLRRETFRPSGYCKTLVENLCGAGTHISHSHRVAIEDLLQTCESAPFRVKTLILEAEERKERAYSDIAHWLKPFVAWDELKTTELDSRALDAKIRAFDFKNLESDPLLQRLAILTLTNRIWTELKAKGAPRTLVVFDEVWKFFAQASGFLEEMYRTFRKYGAGIASVTQNLADYGDDAFARIVITNSFNRVLLQGAATVEVLQSTLDMSESDLSRFLTLASKKNCYSEFLHCTPKSSQILRLHPSPTLFSLANSEDIQNQDREGRQHEA